MATPITAELAPFPAVPSTPSRRRQHRSAIGPAVARLGHWLRATRAHGVWILIWSAVGWVGLAWSPLLLDHPFLLMLLAPRAAFVLLAASDASFLPFVALGTLRLSVTDASWFVAGRHFPRTGTGASAGFACTRWTIRIGDILCRWLCGRPLLAGAVLFFRPNGRYLGVAGAYGVCPRLSAASSLAGTILYLAIVHQGVELFTG